MSLQFLGSSSGSGGSGGAPSGAAGGDLGGTYPNPTVPGLALKEPILSPTAVKAANYTLAAGELGLANAASPFTFTLPTAPADGARAGAKIVLPTSAPSTITVACGGTDTFNRTGGATSLSLTLVGQAVTMQFVAGSPGYWVITDDDLPLSQLDLRFVAPSLVDAKGDLLAGTADNTLARKAVGTNGQSLVADSSQTDGLSWTFLGKSLFGDGSDGDVTISSGTTTLSRDMYYRNLTIASGAVLKPNGYKVFVSATLTNNGTIHNGGSAGSSGGATGSGGSAGNTTQAGGNGGSGSTAAGTVGSSKSNTYGGNGGAGGAGSGGAGAAGGTSTAPNTSQYNGPKTIFMALSSFLFGFPGSFTSTLPSGAAGGGGAGGDGSAQGGAGGGGGAHVHVLAYTVTGTGVIHARGGGGGSNGTNCGGGGGGGGGAVWVVSNSVQAGAVAGQTIDAAGGAGGAGTGTGVSGTAGSAGTVVLLGA